MEFEAEEESGPADDLYKAARPVHERVPQFSGVTGLCRDCTHSFLYQQAYGDEIHVICDAIHPPLRMPLDIVKCSRFERRGQRSLQDLNESALHISKEPVPGQYL